VLAIPFILAINLPVRAYETGDMKWFWLALAVTVGYAVFCFISYILLAGKRRFAKASQIWHTSDE
jgi:ESS family glutamate:Na+ symporter